jgi:phage shock protein C
MKTGPDRLSRMPAEGRIAGVCAGLAAHFDVDVAFVRLAWILLSIFPGGIVGGVVAYGAAWLIMPVDSAVAAPALPQRRLRRSTIDVRIAGVCAGIAEYLDVDPTVVRLVWVMLTIVPGAIVLGVLAYAAAWLIMPAGVAPHMEAAPFTA